MQLWRPEFELVGISSGSWYHCLPIRMYHWLWEDSSHTFPMTTSVYLYLLWWLLLLCDLFAMVKFLFKTTTNLCPWVNSWQLVLPQWICHLDCSEISKVRRSLFQLSKADDPEALPQPVGPSVTLSEKLMVPVNEYPEVCMYKLFRVAYDHWLLTFCSCSWSIPYSGTSQNFVCNVSMTVLHQSLPRSIWQMVKTDVCVYLCT